MSVVPDSLLQSAPEVKPRAAPAKAPAQTAEPRKNEASSFAQVYAKERQAKATERHEAASKPAHDQSDSAAAEPSAPADPVTEPTAVADSGNALPADASEPLEEDAGLESVLDPLLLMAMSGQAPALEPQAVASGGSDLQAASVEVDPQALLGALTPTVAGLASTATAAMTEASHDPQLDELNTVPGVRMALDIDAQAPVAAQQNGPAGAGKTAANAAQDFAGNLAALVEQLQPEGEGELDGDPLSELQSVSLEGLESPKEAAPEVRADNLSARLSALSQAVAQQASQSGRLALAPGQPVAMQQSGWSEAVVDKVMWLSSQNLKSADIQLNPAELGRLEVRVHMAQDQTQVSFASPHAAVRDALEGQMYRLRELFTQQGMNLLDVSVSDQSLNRGWQGQGQDGEGQRRGGSSNVLLAGHDDDLSASVGEVRSGTSSGVRSLVDYYA